MREIVFDTETTGLDPQSGDRIVEIGAVELSNHMPTGKTYHQYINPLRSISEEVVKVHGLTEEFLSDKPTFEEICDDFMAFVGSDAYLVAHNASFDMNFLNYQLTMAGRPTFDENKVIDTLVLARKRFPGSRVNLDDLCRRFGVDNTQRTKHGALLDSELLAEVYLELLGGQEPALLSSGLNEPSDFEGVLEAIKNFERKEPRTFPIPETDAQNHQVYLEKLKNPYWVEMAERKE